MSDEPSRSATLLGRLEAAGILDARACIEAGHVRMGDQVITDPGHPAPWPDRWVLIS
jgi:hypothetical protein